MAEDVYASLYALDCKNTNSVPSAISGVAAWKSLDHVPAKVGHTIV